MRIIWSLLLSLSLSFFLGASNVFASDYIWTATYDYYTRTGSSPSAACSSAISAYNAAGPDRSNSLVSATMVPGNPNMFECRWADKNGYSGPTYGFIAYRSGDSCPPGDTYDQSTGTCSNPDADRCNSLSDQPTKYFKEYDSYAAYEDSPIYCTTSQNGCAVDVCADGGSLDCGTSGKTGKFACWGSGSYTGDVQAESVGGSVAGCEEPCAPPKPTTTDSSNSCTTPTVVNGVTSYTCVSESNSDQFADSNCAVGAINGVTALHCTSPDYVPEADSTVKEDDIEQTTNPDGGSTTVTDSTTTDTHCKSGECTTSTTGTTTTTTKDPNGNTTGESSQCSGSKCDNPTTPEDESEEEEKEEGVEREVSGEDCSSGLLCAGDAIDCAVLRQVKEQRCSMDWNKHKSAVLAEAGKSEYELGTDEIDAADLFSGPSAGRWLSPTCPADRVIHLATTGTSITFSWSFVCQYASGLGNLLVALASLFFAVYVGRAFGGD